MVVLDILGDGLVQVSGAAEACADGPRYTLSQARRGGAGEELRQAYCRGGADTRFALQSGGTLALLLDPGVEAPPIVFTVSSLPLGTSTQRHRRTLRETIFKLLVQQTVICLFTSYATTAQIR